MRSSRRIPPFDCALEQLEARALLDGLGPMPTGATLLFEAAPGLGVKDTLASDMNGDGLKDPIVLGEDRVVVRPYDGNGGFLAARTTLLPANPARFAQTVIRYAHPGDFDGDGHADLLVGAKLTGIRGTVYERTWLLTGDGTGALTLAQTFKNVWDLVGFIPRQVLDIDGDGRDELVRYDGKAYGVVDNAIARRPNASPELATGERVDVDGDGDLDAVGWRVAYHSDGTHETSVVVARNNGSAGYASETIFVTTAGELNGLAFADVSADGAKDLLVSMKEFDAGTLAAASLYAAVWNGTSYALDSTPIYTESAESVRVRGGHSPVAPGWPYNYSASVRVLSSDANMSGNGLNDLSLRIDSAQRWDYRTTGDEDVFDEQFYVDLIATGTTRPSGVSNFTTRAGTPASMVYQQPRPNGWHLIGDIDGDGLNDYVVQRGDAGRHFGQRLAYAYLSGNHLPTTEVSTLYLNGVGTPAIQLSVGDRLRVVVRVDPGADSQTLGAARMFIDSNNNGRWDPGDALLRVGIEQPQMATGMRKFYSFNVIRRATWAGAGHAGVRALFFVPYDGAGNSGVPATWMVNLI